MLSKALESTAFRFHFTNIVAAFLVSLIFYFLVGPQISVFLLMSVFFTGAMIDLVVPKGWIIRRNNFDDLTPKGHYAAPPEPMVFITHAAKAMYEFYKGLNIPGNVEHNFIWWLGEHLQGDPGDRVLNAKSIQGLEEILMQEVKLVDVGGFKRAFCVGLYQLRANGLFDRLEVFFVKDTGETFYRTSQYPDVECKMDGRFIAASNTFIAQLPFFETYKPR